jgi:hypothetical protein
MSSNAAQFVPVLTEHALYFLGKETWMRDAGAVAVKEAKKLYASGNA